VAQDVQEFNRVFQGKLESLMKVRGLILCHLGGELVVLRNYVYLRVRVSRVSSQSSFAER